MSETKVKISELPSSGNDTAGLYTIGVDGRGQSVKIPIGDLLSQTTPLAQAASTAAGEAKAAAQTASTNASTALSNSTTAKTDAAEAKTNASTALTRAGEAKTAAQSAQEAASNAETVAGTAATNAQTAKTTAQAASTAAGEAKAAAQTASTNASEAKETAQAASADASTALNRSQSAKTAAENAEASAGAAQTAAQNAERSAQAAQTAANNATGSITPRMFINADSVLGIRSRRLDTVIELLENRNDIGTFRVKGVVLTFTGAGGVLESWQWSGQNWSNASSWKPYRYTVQEVESEEAMEAIIEGGTADPTVMYFVPEE